MADLREEILLQKKVEKESQRASLSTNDPTSLALAECIIFLYMMTYKNKII